MINAVPRSIAAALDRKAFYFVPLTLSEGDKTLIAEQYDSSLTDRAICHRNIESGNAEYVFISTRLLEDRFSVAFEFYINVGHAFVDIAGLSPEFADLVWSQGSHGVPDQPSLAAFEFRKQTLSDSSARAAEKCHYAYPSA